MSDSIIRHGDGVISVDHKRRRFLTKATTVVGAVGVAAVSIPFVMSWSPSERAKNAGAPVAFDLSKLEPGRQVTVEWRSKPVFVLRRTPEILQRLKAVAHLQQLRDPNSEVLTQQPDYAANAVRSRPAESDRLSLTAARGSGHRALRRRLVRSEPCLF